MGLPEFELSSRRVITMDGVRDAVVVVRDGMIAQITEHRSVPRSIPVEDCGDHVIMAGLVDTHVHVNEPGRTEWEGFVSATKAAAAGGVTTIVDMPLNSHPVTTTSEALAAKLSAAKGKLFVDCGFYAGLVPGNSKKLRSLIDEGVLGVKAFLIDSGIDEFQPAAVSDVRATMEILAESDVPLLVHAELDVSQINNVVAPSDIKSYAGYLSSRPRRWEHDAIELMIKLCSEYRCRVHIVHLSSADVVVLLGEARRSGLPLTVETCPHYLYFAAEEIANGATLLKCAPPIREAENREGLWNALEEGIIDMVVSDHSPCPPQMKLSDTDDFLKAWGGIASLQYGLSVVWTSASQRGISISDVSDWMCRRPAELVGLSNRKGALRSGNDADIVVWDPEASFKVDPSDIVHHHKITPYAGHILRGKVEKTFLAGRKIYDGGRFSDEFHGRIVLGEKNRVESVPSRRTQRI